MQTVTAITSYNEADTIGPIISEMYTDTNSAVDVDDTSADATATGTHDHDQESISLFDLFHYVIEYMTKTQNKLPQLYEATAQFTSTVEEDVAEHE